LTKLAAQEGTMKYRQLANSSLSVSEICLGTMTYGEQNSVADAHQQLDYALARGINFIDTAEMYPVAPRAETQGRTEEYLGLWLKQQARDRLVVATKVTGPARGFGWIRGGPRVTHPQIEQAVDASLKRLQTDYIDLYQIHWPDRNVPMFGQSAFDSAAERDTTPIAEQLAVFADLIRAGKIRYLGLSNETPWGVCQFVRHADQVGLPRVITVQNAYNLINRVFEYGLAEVCYREQVGLLAYSPLGFGTLSGKYRTPGVSGRITQFPGFGQRYAKPNVCEAVAAYSALAEQHGLTPATLALAFVRSRGFVASTIIGATNLDQLKENIDSVDVELNETLLQEIGAIHARFTNPAP
jgi:aryl-alcohol dehydrogenase-like predicted oxidoreductase